MSTLRSEANQESATRPIRSAWCLLAVIYAVAIFASYL